MKWLPKPTRAGWWVRALFHGTMETVLVERADGKLVIRNGPAYELASSWPGKWFGPLTRPKS